MTMRLYRSLQEHLWDRVPVGIFRLTAEADGCFVSANTYVCQFLGCVDFAELVERNPLAFMVDAAAYRAAIQYLLTSGRLTLHELQVRRMDGSEAWISITAELLRDSVGAPLYIDGVFFDVSLHRKTVAELQRSSAIFESLGHLSAMGLFLCNAAGEPTFSNSTCRDIFGYQIETDHENAIWRQSAHPDDRDRVMALWEQCVAKRSAGDALYRFTPPGSTQRLIRVRMAPFFQENGAIEGWVGMTETVPGLISA